MNPEIHDKRSGEFNTLNFTLSNANVSLANALRRTIIADIPIVAFKTTPYTENKCIITGNTSRLNNEILKQRLSCIPIHIKPFTMPLTSLIMELDVENKTDTIMYVTTGDFKIKNIETGTYLGEEDRNSIFPANEQTGYFIDFARLRPSLTDTVPGEKLQLTSEFSIVTASENGMFNTVSLCAYGNTLNKALIQQELAKKREEWKASGEDEESIELKSKDWSLLDAMRLFVPNSFDFSIQTLGVYSNDELVKTACSILIQRFKNLIIDLDANELPIEESKTTMENAFDITIVHEDYTIGKVLEYILHTKLTSKSSALTYCGFCKYHPHDTDSIIRVAYKIPQPIEAISENLREIIGEAIEVYEKIKSSF
jgi:DNA-directed RNA polymerase subunit L